MKDSPQPAKRRRYAAAFRAEALRLASESRSTQAAARGGAELDPATAAELRQLRALTRQQAQELDI